MSSASEKKFDYDVALSFAGEDRPYVKDVAKILKTAGVRVFFDEFEESLLWGKNLLTYLQEIYRDRALYTVIFISQYYNQKLWTTHERESAQARAFKERSEYILPARFDDTELPGLQSTVAYIDLRFKRPREFAEVICSKLGVICSQVKPSYTDLEKAQEQLMQDLPRLVRDKLPSFHKAVASRVTGLFVDQVVSSFKVQLRVGRQYNSDVIWRTISEPLLAHFFGSRSFFANTSDLSLLARRTSASFVEDAVKLGFGSGEADPFNELINAQRGSSISFEIGSAKLPLAANAFLERTAKIINTLAPDTRFEIVGPYDGAPDYAANLELSLARAYEIRQTLIRYGVPSHMLFIREHGPYLTAVSKAVEWWVTHEILPGGRNYTGQKNPLVNLGAPQIVMPAELSQRIRRFCSAYVQDKGVWWVTQWAFTLCYFPSKKTFEKIKLKLTPQLEKVIASRSLTDEVLLNQLNESLPRLWASASA